jgi:hypothetical protein
MGVTFLSQPGQANAGLHDLGTITEKRPPLVAGGQYPPHNPLYTPPGLAFSMSINVNSTIIRKQGDGSWPAKNFTITVTSTGNFTGIVRLSPSLNISPGLLIRIVPGNVSVPAHGFATATLEISNPSGQTGTWEITIFGENGLNSAGVTIDVSYVVPLNAQYPYTVGVHTGTWAYYNITITSQDSVTLFANLTVTSVSGTNVTFREDLYEGGGLLNSTLGWIDVYTGDSFEHALPFFLTAAYLKVGSPLYLGQVATANVQSRTVSRVGTTSRETNLAQCCLNPYSDQVSASWDVRSGVLVSLNATLRVTPVNSGLTTLVYANYRLVATSAWVSASIITPSIPLPLVPTSFDSQVSGGSPPYKYNWNFGDGMDSADRTPIHIFLFPGSYAVTLRVTDAKGDSETQSVNVVVGANVPSPSTFLANITQGLATRFLVVFGGYLSTIAIFISLVVRRERGKQRKLISSMNEWLPDPAREH